MLSWPCLLHVTTTARLVTGTTLFFKRVSGYICEGSSFTVALCRSVMLAIESMLEHIRSSFSRLLHPNHSAARLLQTLITHDPFLQSKCLAIHAELELPPCAAGGHRAGRRRKKRVQRKRHRCAGSLQVPYLRLTRHTSHVTRHTSHVIFQCLVLQVRLQRLHPELGRSQDAPPFPPAPTYFPRQTP